MLIRGYGEFWSPEVVHWGERGRSRGELPGVARPPSGGPHDVDVWEAMAIYVLWKNYQPVYVGKATGQRGLGPRLRDHLTDRLNGRWDLFSWYSLSKPLRSGGVSQPGARQVSPSDVLATFEAFAQRLELPLNRRMEGLPAAILVEQSLEITPVEIQDLDERLEVVEEKLNDLLDVARRLRRRNE